MEFKNIDLRNDCMPTIRNQANRGSCMAQACVSSVEYQINRIRKFINERIDKDGYSVEFTYYMSRWLGNNRDTDTGSHITYAMTSMLRFGILEKRNYNEVTLTEPSFYALATAHNNRINAFYSIDKNKESIVAELWKQIPIVITIDADKISDIDNKGLSKKCLSWAKNETNTSPHGVNIVGYLKDFDYYGTKKEVFVIRNSWGISWGDKGYFYIPCEQLIKYNLYEAYCPVKDKIDNDAPNYKYNKTIY